MLRRELLQQASLSALAFIAGCKHTGSELPTPGDGTPLIDAHCHVFNASDLPAARFLRQVVFEDYPSQSYRTLGIRDPDAGDVFFELLLHLLGADRAPSAKDEIAYLSGAPGHPESAKSQSAARKSAIRDTASFLRKVDRRARRIATMQAPSARDNETTARDRKFLDFMLGPTRVRSFADQPLSMSEAQIASRNAFTGTSAIARYLNWFSLFRLYRHVLVAKLIADTKRQGFRPIMLTPALVDYDEWLYEDVKSPLDQQAAVMDLISQQVIRAKSQPIVHGYIGFDPLREVAHRGGKSRVSSLETARNALVDHGFFGVKLYPPMGFRPSGNSKPYPKRTITSLGFDPSKQLDQALLDLYSLCVELDAPILAHGYASNGSGPQYELRGDSAYWIPVFERFRSLRVCIAHFGRFDTHSAGWEKKPLPEGSWEWRLGRFIKENPRQPVFADISYFSEALSAKPEQRQTLARDFKLWASNFDPELDHLIFGSDWIMLGKEAGYKHYIGSVNSFLRTDCGFSDDTCDKIFRRNAMRFLPLERSSKGRARMLAYYRKNGLDEPRLPATNTRLFAGLFRG